MGMHEWGSSTVVVANTQYVIKELVLLRGQTIPWHRHLRKAETHICIAGEGLLLIWDSFGGPEQPAADYWINGTRGVGTYQRHDLRPGYLVDVPPGRWHALLALPSLGMTVLEPQGVEVEDIQWL